MRPLLWAKILIFTDKTELNPITILVRGDIRLAELDKQKVKGLQSAQTEEEKK